MKISDSELYARLAVLLDGEVKARMIPRQNPAQPYDLQLTSEVFDNHRGDSPDAILRITIVIGHPSLPKMKIVIPVPLEGEKLSRNNCKSPASSGAGNKSVGTRESWP